MVFWGREHHLSLEQECQYLQSLGFGIELWPTIKGHEECRYDRRNWPRLSAATQGMLASLHGRTDKPTLEEWNEQIECAKMLDAHIVTDLDNMSLAKGTYGNDDGYAEEVVRLAEYHGLTLCIETGRLEVLKEVGKRFSSVRYCLDTGYANLDKDHSFKEYIDELARRVAHLHLTDNYGQMDDHEPPGLNGGISRENWDSLLEGLDRHDNEIVGSFEMCPCAPSVLIRQASEFVFDTLRWPNRPQHHPEHVTNTYKPA
jgi:sugar phosphate isomerase/epimerase